MMSQIYLVRSPVLAGALFASLALTGHVGAQTVSVLTGSVTSQEEGVMEGVLVSAKRAGSTITTTVVSDAQGQFSFPRDRTPTGHIFPDNSSRGVRAAKSRACASCRDSAVGSCGRFEIL